MSVSIVLKTILDDKGLKNAQKSFTSLGKTITKVGATIGAALSIKAFTNMAKAAAEDAKSQALLANQLRNTIDASDAQIQSVEGSIRAMQLQAAVADDVIRPAFGQLVRATGSITESTRIMQIALDVSAATGRDIGAVTIALSKAYQGNTTALSRLGIKAEEGADVFAMLEEQFAGAAETAARKDPFQRIAITVGELQETIGEDLLPYLNRFADYLNSAEFGKAFTEMAIAIGEAISQVDIFFQKISGVGALTFFLDFLRNAAIGLAEIAFFAGDTADVFSKLFKGDFEGAGKLLLTYTQRYEKFVDDIYKKLSAGSRISGKKNRVQDALDNFVPKPDPEAEKGLETQFQKVQKIIKNYQSKIIKAEQEYSKAKLEINQQYEENVAEIRKEGTQKQLDIVNESIDRLRNAFRSATQFGLGDLFGSETVSEVTTQVKKLSEKLTVTVATETQRTIGGTVDSLISSLAERIAASKALVKSASDLAAKGFSQTFIEQVVETGADTGNALANAILTASPEQQAALKQNFLELETVSETGMDALARQIYESQGLATRELKALYATVQQELDDALIAEQARLAKALLDAGYAFRLSISEIRSDFEDVIDSLDGKFAGLGKNIDALLAKMKMLQTGPINDIQSSLTGPGGILENNVISQDVKVEKNAFNAAGIVIDSAADVAGSIAYLQARIEGAKKYLQNVGRGTTAAISAESSLQKFTSELNALKTAAASSTGGVGTIVNINVKTDTTQNAAMVGKTIGKVITKYTSTGGTVRVSGQQ